MCWALSATVHTAAEIDLKCLALIFSLPFFQPIHQIHNNREFRTRKCLPFLQQNDYLIAVTQTSVSWFGIVSLAKHVVLWEIEVFLTLFSFHRGNNERGKIHYINILLLLRMKEANHISSDFRWSLTCWPCTPDTGEMYACDCGNQVNVVQGSANWVSAWFS